jgi:hypothetical protein
MLLIFLILVSINTGCAEKVVYVNVPQKCYITDTPKPIIEDIHTNNILDAVKIVYKNYLKEKEYAETLEQNSKVCQ